jgi:hypothetical protein
MLPQVWTDTWATVFGILALIVAGEASSYNPQSAVAVSLGFDGISCVLDGISLRKDASLQNVFVAFMDSSTLALDVYVA